MSAKPKARRSPVKTNDSMTNLMSGLGTDRDKATGASFILNTVNQQQLDYAYRGDWMARKIVDIPAEDSTREWRAWQAEGNQIEDIEAEEKRLGLQRKVMQVLQKSRLYGGAALVIGIRNDMRPELPLDVERVQKDGLAFVHVVSRFELTAGQINLDVLSPLYGEPEYYEVISSSKGTVRVHPSRVLRFIGKELPSLQTALDPAWGDSILQSTYDAVVAAAQSLAAIAALIQEAKIDVIQIPNFMQQLASAEYRSRIIERFQLANTGKSLVNSLMLDKEEEWQRHQQAFNGLPELSTVFLQIVSGAADIPVTRMLGQSPAGMNATGESDIRNYYDSLASRQDNVITPALERLDEVMIRSALGDRPEEIHYEWNSLWQMSDVDKAAMAYQKAQTFQIDVNSGAIDPMALGKARINQLVEDGTYPGLEEAIEEAATEMESGENQEQREAFEAARQAKLAAAGGGPPGEEEEEDEDA